MASKTALASVAEGGRAVDDDLVERERTVTKCICRVLNGFNCEAIPDAAEEYLRRGWEAPLAATEKNAEEIKNNYSGKEIGLEFEDVLKRASAAAAEDGDEEAEGESDEEEVHED